MGEKVYYVQYKINIIQYNIKVYFPLGNNFYIASFPGGGGNLYRGKIELHRCVSCYDLLNFEIVRPFLQSF